MVVKKRLYNFNIYCKDYLFNNFKFQIDNDDEDFGQSSFEIGYKFCKDYSFFYCKRLVQFSKKQYEFVFRCMRMINFFKLISKFNLILF